MTLPSRPGIQWPSGFRPDQCPVHVRDELSIAADPRTVWSWLIRAESWPAWYDNSADVVIQNGLGPDIFLGARFSWRTFGIGLESEVLEFSPPHRLGWTAKGLGVDAYHAWLIERRDQGCWVLTEETQRGWLAVLSDLFRPHRMNLEHRRWLHGLQVKALGGPAS